MFIPWIKLASVLEQVELSIKQVKQMQLCSGEEKKSQENFRKKNVSSGCKKENTRKRKWTNETWT